MSPDLEETLFNRYPKIFSLRRPFECGDGWFDLIDRLCARIQFHLDKNPVLAQVEALQVKEKFGGLRFYTNLADNDVASFIGEAEDESMDICEVCSSTHDVETRGPGWIRTLCTKCRSVVCQTS